MLKYELRFEISPSLDFSSLGHHPLRIEIMHKIDDVIDRSNNSGK